MRLIAILAAAAASSAFATEPTALEHLTVFLTGSFSNAEQARGDQNFRPTVLHVGPIWPERNDGPWLYVEQALADAIDHPFRQYVYQLRNGSDQKLEILPFEIPDPVAATGAWRDPARMNQFSPEKLRPKPGCRVVLELRPGGSFQGGTEGTGCASDLRGATFSSLQMAVSNVEIMTWERGYNAAGTQVWGSIHGGYLFKRVE